MDRELIDFLAQRFGETNQQIQGLRQEMVEGFATLRQEVSERFEQVDRRFEQVEESIRHTRVELEGLHGEVRLVADGVAAVNEKLDTSRAEVAREIEETRQLVRLSHRDLDRRVRALEARAAQHA